MFAILYILCHALLVLSAPVKLRSTNGYKNVGYFPNWGIYGRNFQPADIPASYLTHLHYAFANVDSSGNVVLSDTYADLQKTYPGDDLSGPSNDLYGCLKQILLIKQKNRNLKNILSVGGWTYSPNFPSPMSTSAGRSAFASTLMELVKDLGFDGVDIDWEYPTAGGQATNLIELVAGVRTQFDNYISTYAPGSQLSISLAVGAGPIHYEALDMTGLEPYIDYVGLMAYDFMGSWSNNSGDQANLFSSTSTPTATEFNADDAVKAYIAGFGASKVVLGLPAYGRSFTGTAGRGKPFSGVGSGSWENGVWDYKSLPVTSTTVVSEDDQTVSSWSYDPEAQMLVSYDTPAVAIKKAQYLMNLGLGGAMWWDLTSDFPVTNVNSLIANVVNAFGGTGALQIQQNMIDYSHSTYPNVAAGL